MEIKSSIPDLQLRNSLVCGRMSQQGAEDLQDAMQARLELDTRETRRLLKETAGSMHDVTQNTTASLRALTSAKEALSHLEMAMQPTIVDGSIRKPKLFPLPK